MSGRLPAEGDRIDMSSETVTNRDGFAAVRPPLQTAPGPPDCSGIPRRGSHGQTIRHLLLRRPNNRYSCSSGSSNAEYLRGPSVMPRYGRWTTAWERVVRRSADILIAGSALLVLSPLMVIIAVAIRLTSPGPAVFIQRRIGFAREPFAFAKFRTMRVDGDDAAHREMIARELRGEDTSNGGSWKLDGDNRITGLGSFLRRTSLDELPQLINVVRGDMTLVGPRPCLEWEAQMFPSEFDERFAVRPGVTGLWQVSGRSTMGTLDMLRLDVYYVRHQTLRGDVAIVARTVPTVLRGDGAR